MIIANQMQTMLVPMLPLPDRPGSYQLASVAPYNFQAVNIRQVYDHDGFDRGHPVEFAVTDHSANIVELANLPHSRITALISVSA